MTYNELIAEVYIQTNRPDLVNETASAIRAATLKMHQLGYWDRDLFETGIQFIIPDYFQQIDITLLVPNHRAIKYVRKVDSVSAIPGKEFELITPDSAFDAYTLERTDVMYLAGNSINIKSSTKFQYAIFSSYLNPNITVTGYNSWIAVAHPYAIVYEACRTLFKGIGLDEESRQQQSLVQEQIQALIVSNTVANGY